GDRRDPWPAPSRPGPGDGPARTRRSHAMTGQREVPPGGEAGAVSVEMVVFVVPVTVALTLLVVVCARVASASISVDAASAAGARAAAAASSASQARAAAREVVAASSDLGRTCTASVDTGAFRPGGQVTVRVTCSVAL